MQVMKLVKFVPDEFECRNKFSEFLFVANNLLQRETVEFVFAASKERKVNYSQNFIKSYFFERPI